MTQIYWLSSDRLEYGKIQTCNNLGFHSLGGVAFLEDTREQLDSVLRKKQNEHAYTLEQGVA